MCLNKRRNWTAILLVLAVGSLCAAGQDKTRQNLPLREGRLLINESYSLPGESISFTAAGLDDEGTLWLGIEHAVKQSPSHASLWKIDHSVKSVVIPEIILPEKKSSDLAYSHVVGVAFTKQ